jgi:hypothetical protein
LDITWIEVVDLAKPVFDVSYVDVKRILHLECIRSMLASRGANQNQLVAGPRGRIRMPQSSPSIKHNMSVNYLTAARNTEVITR